MESITCCQRMDPSKRKFGRMKNKDHKVYAVCRSGFDEEGHSDLEYRLVASGLDYKEADKITDREIKKPDVEDVAIAGPDVSEPEP